MVAVDAPPYFGGLGEPSVRPYSTEDHPWAVGLLEKTGGRYRVRRGNVVDVAVLPGLVGSRDGVLNTLVTITRHSHNFELSAIASDPFDEELVQQVVKASLQYRNPDCQRSYAIVSNAQLKVQRALQLAGFRLCATRPGGMESLARRSEYPIVTRFDGLEVRDEVEFDLLVF